MKNKILDFLPLFLLFSTAAQCMEQTIVVKPKTMQEIRNDRDEIYRDRLRVEKARQSNGKITLVNSYVVLDHILFQGELSLVKKFLSNESYKDCRIFEEYSYLGIAVIAIKRPQFTYEDSYGAFINQQHIAHPKQAPFKEKQEYIKKLRALGFKPTDADKEFDRLNACELSALSRLYLKYSSSEVKLLQEIINYISLLMFKTNLFFENDTL